jgi:class 3 adenylate cyclase/predicted negative regulator of RcsB-dependent stress response
MRRRRAPERHEDIGGWLRGLGLERYEQAFRENEIDLRDLPELTAEDLKELGVAAIGHRRLLLKAIADLAAGAGRAAAEDVPAASPANATGEAERRQLTVMFCDLVGSTALSVRFDPEELREEIRAYQNAVSGVVARYDGFVAKYMGDGVLAYFGYPRAHEDDAERAVRAGLEIAAAVTRLETRGTVPLAVRIGIATGLVVVGDLVGEGSAQEQAVVGETPNLAARLQALAQPRQIVLAGATRRLIGDMFRLRDLGRQEAKGFAEPVEAFAVEGVAAAESRFEAAPRRITEARHADFANRFGWDPRAAAEIYDALTLWVLGRIDEALRLADRALADAESAAHAPTMAHALDIAARLGLLRYSPEAVATYSRALADIVSRYDLPASWAGFVIFLQGWAKRSDAAEESSLAEMRRGLAINREQGFVSLLAILEAALAEAEPIAGETDAGLRRLDDALAELERTEQHWYEAEMHRFRGEILLKRDPAEIGAAEQSLQAAIAIAQSQKARSFELRAALALAKLYRAANRDTDAHAALVPSVEGFPPTQQFPELTEAQALLSALSESDAVKSAAALHQRRVHLQISLGNALIWAKGFHAPETSAAFARARELASREKDASERFSAYYGLWVGHFVRSEPVPMRDMAELFLREATARPDCPEALVAHRISSTTCLYFGDFAGAHDHFQQTIELYDRARHADFANRFGHDTRAVAEVYDAIALWVLGGVDEALRLVDRALSDAASTAHAPTMGHALAHAALLGLLQCNLVAVATDSQALADIVSRYDLPALWAGFAVFFQGWAKWPDGAEESRLAEMRRGLAIEREQGLVWLLPGFEAALAEAEASAGETDAGLRRLDDALAELEATENRWYEAEIHRVRGEILLKRDPANTAAAEQSLQAAIVIAQSQRGRCFELRAALSLAKLYRAANRDAAFLPQKGYISWNLRHLWATMPATGRNVKPNL